MSTSHHMHTSGAHRPRKLLGALLLLVMAATSMSGCRLILHDGKKSPDRWDKKRVARKKALSKWKSFNSSRKRYIKSKNWSSLVYQYDSYQWAALLKGDEEFLPKDSLEEYQMEDMELAFSHAGELAIKGKYDSLAQMVSRGAKMKYADGGELDVEEIFAKSLRRSVSKKYLAKKGKEDWEGAANAVGGTIVRIDKKVSRKLAKKLTSQARSYRKRQILTMEKEADRLVKARKFDPARRAYAKAIAYYTPKKGAKAPARNTRRNTRRRRYGSSRNRRSADLQQRQVALYKNIMKPAESKRLDQKLANVTLLQARDLVAQAKGLERKNQHRVALQKFDEAVGLLANAEIKRERQQGAQRWIAKLVKQARGLERSHAGHALLLYAKAAQLGDRSSARKRDSLRNALKQKYAYKVAVNATGPSGAVSSVESMKRGSFSQNLRIVSGGADATIAITIGQASDRISSSTSSGSGKYKSGTEKYKNPRIDKIKSEIRSAERDYSHAKTNFDSKKRDKERNLKQYAKAPKLQKSSYKRGAEHAQKEMNRWSGKMSEAKNKQSRLKGELSSAPKYLSRDKFSRHTYTITKKTLTVRASFNASIRHSDGRGGLRHSDTLSDSRSDTTHSAQPKLKLSADPLNLPSASSLISGVYRQAGGAAKSAVLKSLRNKQEWWLSKGKRASGSAKLDAYVVYLLLDPATADKAVASDIQRATDITGVRGLINAR